MLDERTKETVRLAREYLFKSDLAEDRKDNLAAILSAAAAAANGSVDRVKDIAEFSLHSAIAHIKQTVRLPHEIREAAQAIVAAHVGACAGSKPAKAPPAPVTPTGWQWILKDCLKSWPLAIVVSVAFVAPNAPAIIQTVVNAFK